jgi:hypothetical protein
MNNHPIAFLLCGSNDMFSSQQNTCLLSSPFPSAKPKQEIKSGNGFYIYRHPKDSIRRVVALYCVRRLPIYEWHKNTDVFIGRSEDE